MLALKYLLLAGAIGMFIAALAIVAYDLYVELQHHRGLTRGTTGYPEPEPVAQYWFNGTLVIDRHDLLFRTGAHPNINFHQFLITPYIGDGSPVDQYMWVDDLMVATSKP